MKYLGQKTMEKKSSTFTGMVLDVRMNKEYYGTLPKEDNIVKVFYSKAQSSTMFQDSVILKKGADVICDTSIGTFPVEGENIVTRHFFFSPDVCNQYIPLSTVNTDKLTTPEKSSSFIALKRDVFDKAFVKLFQNPNLVPTSIFTGWEQLPEQLPEQTKESIENVLLSTPKGLK